MSSFTQIISDLRKEIEVIKKIQKIEDGEWLWNERLKAIDFLKAKLDQTLLCEKMHKEFIQNLKKTNCYRMGHILDEDLAELESEVTK